MIAKKKEEVEKEKKLKKKNENDLINNGEAQENKKTESSSNHNSNNIKEENYFSTINEDKLERNKKIMIKHMKTLDKKADENKNIINNIININEPKIPKKRSFLGNVGHSFKIGIKGVFKRVNSKKKSNK